MKLILVKLMDYYVAISVKLYNLVIRKVKKHCFPSCRKEETSDEELALVHMVCK